MSYEITRRQSTFWDLRHDGLVERIHFEGKEEFEFREPSAESISIVEEHAVLLDYSHAWEHVYLAGPVRAPDEVAHGLTQAIEARLEPWRSARRYLNPFGAKRILRGGHGCPLTAPRPIADACRAVLEASGARFTSLPSRPPRWPRTALIAGSNFVVAKSFRVEIVPF